jgi:hypothetical protein
MRIYAEIEKKEKRDPLISVGITNRDWGWAQVLACPPLVSVRNTNRAKNFSPGWTWDLNPSSTGNKAPSLPVQRTKNRLASFEINFKEIFLKDYGSTVAKWDLCKLMNMYCRLLR